MAGSFKDEQAALSRAVGNSYLDQCRALLKTDKEHVQAAYWSKLPQRVREMACHMAGLGAKKGKGALRDLSANDRAVLNATLRNLIPALETMLRCAQGGVFVDATGGDRAHQEHANLGIPASIPVKVH